MSKQLLNIVGISSSNLQSNSFALILEVESTKQRIPIIIGPAEAQSIAIEMEGMATSRPLTHDLLKNILNTFEVKLIEVYINKFREGVFYSTLVLLNGDQQVEIDSRTSDAVALAVRMEAPIYANDLVIKETAMSADISIDEDTDDIFDDDIEEEDEMSIEELEALLQHLIEDENYEEASKIRDEINLRKQE
ncbi:MAG: hypothetical protein B6I18_08525 [Bacteroidetes bacterium 4572_112]|nr:MAG: hypothetical protein B6I18_08525 [Bacteroidetes bacterium 4572_112]